MSSERNRLHWESTSGEDHVSVFQRLSEEYASHMIAAGSRCRPYAGSEPRLFAKADGAVQQRALSFLRMALATFEEMALRRERLTDNRVLLWRVLSRLGYAPESDLFDRITDEDVVEIYSLPEHLHLGWNIKLMESLSHTVEQVLCLPWWELVERPPEINERLGVLGLKLINDEITTSFVPDVPVHVITEIGSEELLIFEFQLTLVSPIRQNNRNVGFIAVSRNRVLGSRANRHIG